ncbi:MAG TPA: pitrilysin family protein [Bacteroidia bacterium]|nr:pitrilysin family protein [Bacteroidia bacterium]
MSINRLQAPAYSINFSFPEITPDKVILNNKIPVYIINAGSQALSKIEMVFNAGNYFETSSLIANATNALLREGTTSKSAGEIAELLDYYGAFLETSVYKDKASVILYTLNKHLHHTLPVLVDLVQNAIFPEKELHLYKTNQKQKFLVNQQKVDFIARNHFNNLLFKNTAYDQFVKEEDYDALSQMQVQHFFKERYSGSGLYLVLAGAITDDVINQVKATAGTIVLKNEESKSQYSNLNHGRAELFIEKQDAMQSAIRIGRRLFNKTHTDYFGMQILNTVLGGYFGSRLMSNIREDKGYTYGIGSGIASLLHDGFFYISTEVGVDVTKATLIEIYKEIEKLQNELISDNELDLVKNYMLGTFLRSVDGPFAMSEKFTAIKDYGLTNEFYHTYVNYIKQAKAEELMLLAQKYLSKNDLSELVVGKI